MSDKLIGDIRAYLEQRKMSQEEFARELGISFTTLNRWLNKKTTPRSKVMVAAIRRLIGK